MWHKIPKDIMDELEALRQYTKKTNREASFTFCKRPHKEKLYIGSNFEGDDESVLIGDCSKELGKGTRIGDAHSHPTVSDGVGITPSDADIAGTVGDSYYQKRPQIACITANGADMVHCMSPKQIPTRAQFKAYSKVPRNPYKVNPHVVDNVAKDMDIALFDTDTGNRIENPDPKRVIKNAFGKSRRHVQKTRHKMEHGAFCEYIQDVFVPNDDRIHDECKAELKRKGLLDYLGLE